MCRGPFSLFAALSQGGSGNGASSSPQCYPYHHQLCSVIYIPVSIVSATVKSCGLLLICQSSSGLVLFVLLSGLGLCKTDIRNFQEQQGLELVVKDFRFLHSSPLALSLIAVLGLRGNSLKFNRALLSKSRINKLVSTFI